MNREYLILLISIVCHVALLNDWFVEEDLTTNELQSIGKNESVARTIILRSAIAQSEQTIDLPNPLESINKQISRYNTLEESSHVKHFVPRSEPHKSNELAIRQSIEKSGSQGNISEVSKPSNPESVPEVEESLLTSNELGKNSREKHIETSALNDESERLESQNLSESSGKTISVTDADDKTDVLASVGKVDEKNTSDIEQSYLDELRALISQMKRYPKKAIRRRQEGIVWVEFSLDQRGVFEDVRLLESSGYSALDKAAISTISKIEKFKPVPKELAVNTLNLSVPVHYVLR